jgi:DNA polymerase III beta subunit, N-terminal domain
MKFTCDTRALLGALDACAAVAPTKTTMPILQQALLCADIDGMLRAFATDLNLRVQHTLPATIDEPGQVLVPARYCAEWLDEVDDLGCPITLELDEAANRLHWRCGPYRLRTTLMDTADFPDVVSPTLGAPNLAVDPGALASILPSLLAVAHAKEDRVHVTMHDEHVAFYVINDRQLVVAALRNHGEPYTLNGLPPPWTEWPLPTAALTALAASPADTDCTHLAIDATASVVVLSRPGVEVVAHPDSWHKPVPGVADIASALVDGIEVDRRALQRVFDAGALFGTVADLSYEPERCVLQIRAQREDDRVNGDTRAEAPVLRGPPDKCGVTFECGRVPRLISSLPGSTLGLAIDDLVGGPGVQLWPIQALPDGARVMHVVRAHSTSVAGGAGKGTRKGTEGFYQ